MSLQRNVETIRTLTLALIICAIASTASAVGPPHDGSNSIGCLTCHDMTSSEPRHIVNMGDTSVSPDDTAFNNKCLSCHTNTGSGTGPLFMDTHSSNTTSKKYGNWIVECFVCHNIHDNDQGPWPANPLIRKRIDLSEILNSGKTGIKAVTFTGANYTDAAGNGICQVCHTQTTYYRNDGTGLGHNTGTDCLTCHAHGQGFVGGADHSAFIITDSDGVAAPNTTFCTDCHTAYANPETGHSSCQACHTTSIPAINNNPMPTGQPDSDTGNSYDNLIAAGYSFTGTGGRLVDAAGNDIKDNPAAFNDILCGVCHNSKPAALAAGTHGGHVATDFAWSATCSAVGCHDSGTNTNIVADIHASSCTTCHDNPLGGIGTTIPGDPTNGIDGDATRGAALADYKTATCLTCHDPLTTGTAVNAATIGGIHHDNKTDGYPVVEANCTAKCHNVAGHEGNHGVDVADTTNCNTCHTGTAGSTTTGAVPINGTDNKVHDGCTSCHLIAPQAAADGQLQAITAPGGSANIASGDCNTCHDAYFASHTTPDARHTTLSAVSPCLSCHTGGIVTGATGTEANQGTHESNCADCHNLTNGARVDGSFNAASYMGTGVNVGDAAVNGGAGGTCVECHNTPPNAVAYFDGHRHTHNLQVNVDCGTCHNVDNTDGSGARNAVSAPFASTGEVHGTAGCATCHNLSTPNDGSLRSLAAGKTGNEDCIGCHITGTTNTWMSIHTSAESKGNVDHATARVTGAAACTQCHGNPTPASSNARDAKVSPFIATGDVHAGGCVLCHTGDNNGALQPTPTKADQVAAGDCTTCHTLSSDWTSIHATATGAAAGVDHTTRVDGLASCITCHTATAGGTNGQMPYDPADDQVHDSCAACHSSTGLPLQSTQTPNGWATSVAAGDCGTCHGSTYFDSHVHGQDGGYVDHTVSYNSSVDISQVSNPAPCGNCHNGNNADGNGTPLDSWTDILSEHVTGCARCHSYTDDGNATPPQTDNDNTIANNVVATCTTCHTPKLRPAASSDHGGHPDTHFGWSGTCQNCHGAGSGTEGVVSVIHNNVCDTCHTTGGPYDATTNDVGDPTYGIDGDATLAEGAAIAATPFDPTFYTCATCHAIGSGSNNAATLGGIHHENKSTGNGVAVSNTDCATCHTVSGHEGDHTNLVADSTTNCISCHTNTKGGITGVPLDPVDDKVHDVCMTCHGISPAAARDGYLLTLAEADIRGGVVTAMPNGGTGTNNGGGDCTACHTTYFNSHTHSHTLGADADCATCHAPAAVTGSNARIATTAPFVATGTRDEVHAANGCATCHAADGSFVGSAVGGTTASTCISCHVNTSGKTWTVIHTAALGTVQPAVDHTGRVSNDAACNSCHANVAGSNARDAITTPFTQTATEVHNGSGCLTCHSGLDDGSMRTDALAKADTIDTTSATCATCHTVSSTWETIHSTGTGAVSGVDHTNRVDALASCITCHTSTAGGSGGLMPINTTDDKVHDACLTCHTTGGLLLQSAGGYAVAVTPGNCGTCHTSTYFDSHVHGQDGGYVNHTVSHNTSVDLAQAAPGQPCMNCHDGNNADGNGTALDSWTDILSEHVTGCGRCHSYTDDGKATPPQAANDNAIANNTVSTCVTCHTPKVQPATHGGHAANHFGNDPLCSGCHTVPATGVVEGIHKNNCDLCHTNPLGTRDKTSEGPGPNGDGDASGANGAADAATPFDPNTYTCTTCHDPALTGVTRASYGGLHHSNEGSVTYDPTACTNCHTATSHVTQINDSTNACNTCHTLTQGTATGAPVAPGDPKVHDACITCHEFAATPALNGQLVAPTGNKGVNAMKTNPADCVDCHTSPKKDIHHGTTLATSGTCQACHVNSQTTGVGPTAPQQMACKECHVDETQTGLRIVSLRLANGDGTQPTHFENKNSAIDGSRGAGLVTDASGYVTAHDITFTSPIAINDYRSCFACHNGSYPGAAAVAPFHGYPGDAANAYIETGNTAYTNKTILGGGQVSLDEISNNNNLLPLPFMYYHPGHNSFRRFGETATMTRRSVQNGDGVAYADNSQLYRNAGIYANAIRKNNYNAATVEDYLRKAGNNYPGGECTHGGGNAWNTGTNLDIACLERKNNSAGLAHETPVTGYALRIASIPYTNFSASDGNAPAGTGYGMLNNIPYFSAVAAPNDRVFVNSAEVDASKNLIVVASNDEGCAKLTVTESAGGGGANYGTMSLNATTGYCELTVAVTAIPTHIDVTSSGTGTPSVTNFPVVNNSSVPTTVTITSGPHSWTPTAVGIGDVTTVTATSADALTGMNLSYNGSNYAMTDVGGGTSWSYTLTNVPYAATVEAIANDATYSGQSGTMPVSNNGDVITVTSATYTGTTLDVALTTSQVNTSVSIDYNNDGATTPDLAMTDAGGGTSWTYTGTEASYNSPITIYTSKFGQDTNVVVTNNNNSAPTLSIAAPNGVTINVGDAFNITYTMNDTDDVATVSFYYDDDTNPGNGNLGAVTGCSSQPEGTGVTCSGDSTGITAGGAVYYILGVATDGVNPDVTSYSGTLTVNDAPTSMPGSDGTTVDGIFPGDNFATNGSATVNVSFTTANAGDKNNYWTLWDEAQNGTAFCTGSFSTSDGGSNYTATIDFSTCGAPAGQYFLEYAIEDNTTGAKFKIKYLPITLGTTTEYYKVFSDAAYTTETTSFNSTDMVYVEVNSAAVHGVLGGTCDGTQAAKMAGFDDTKYIDKLDFSSCTYQGGNVYRWSFDLSQQSISFPSGTYWYQGEMKPADSSGKNNIKVGMLLEITAP